MRWKGRRQSSNIEDQRGRTPRRNRGLKGGGIGTLVIVLGALYFGVDPSVVLNLLGGATSVSAPATEQTAEDQALAEFTAVVLADTEDVWHELFRQQGYTYKEPKLVLFSGAVQSACGQGNAAMGPFYCPADQKVYIDLGFYRDLKRRHQAPGDFAQAYVIAHEVGHHVQTLLGVSAKVHAAKQRVSQQEANQLSVRQELQADCFSGVWAYHAQRTKQVLEPGDIDEALNAASQIGDDRLQRQSRGYVTPESFTHGSSQQRVRWFKRGFQTGNLNQCDTFSVRGSL